MLTDKELFLEAVKARKNAYCPYSGYAVGAALLTADGQIFHGCNIENSAYGPTVCAERCAIFAAVSQGIRNFTAIAIAGGTVSGDSSSLSIAYPCGVCRQVLAEFCPMDFPVIVARSPEDYEVYTLGDLLPQAFTPLSL